jgi:16S rRNA (guanine527-N7)-methyltransferase
VQGHIDHAAGFAAALSAVTGSSPPAGGRLLDLGAGGGVPGLVLATLWPEVAVVLLESSERRVAFLADALTRLALGERVSLCHDRAEDAGRRPAMRGGFGVVVARSFGGPAVTAECGAPLLRVGGHLVVSDPPGGPGSRWPTEGLGALGLGPAVSVSVEQHFAVIEQLSPCPEGFPRRVGVPARRPLF